MVASKYLTDEGEDEEVFNDEWAECGKYFRKQEKLFQNFPVGGFLNMGILQICEHMRVTVENH